MEHIVTKHILNYLEHNNILYDLQHGFRSKRSTETQLLTFSQDILNNLRANQQSDVIIMDFAKAFDKVPHNRLIHKLHRYGIGGKVNGWVEDFLKDRQQRVVCEGEMSEWEPVTSGVPQGSVIGPILFLLYINDLPDGLQSQVRLFADDTIVYMAISSKKQAEILQSDLDKLADWEDKWQMKFHPQKCSVLRITTKHKPLIFNYTLHGHILEEEESSKYLGITINNRMSWNPHITATCKKANSTLGFLKRNLQIPQQHIKENAYKTLVRPQLEYAAAVWDPYTKENKQKIEMVQRRAARYVCNDYSRESSVTAMLSLLGWRTLEQRRADIRLTLFYKIVNGLVAIDYSMYLNPITRKSRHHHPQAYLIPAETQLYIQQSYLPRTIVQWNRLPANIAMATTLDAFKSGVSTLTH